MSTTKWEPYRETISIDAEIVVDGQVRFTPGYKGRIGEGSYGTTDEYRDGTINHVILFISGKPFRGKIVLSDESKQNVTALSDALDVAVKSEHGERFVDEYESENFLV